MPTIHIKLDESTKKELRIKVVSISTSQQQYVADLIKKAVKQ